jgi:hypothetical protein
MAKDYRNARAEWEAALKEAGDDKQVAFGLLLARILEEAEDQNSKMEALAEARQSILGHRSRPSFGP